MNGYPKRIAARLRLVLGLLAVGATGAAAQEVTEHDYLADLPPILSVSRLAQPLRETPGAVTVIDAETIRRSGAREVAELLRLVPGFLITRRNGGSAVAAYHSALDVYGARMQVYVDGRSVYSSFYLGDTHRGLAAVDLADIQRIEILRGSNSAAFGANAFLGVVNIITRAAADTHGVTTVVARGDRGIDDNFVRVGWSGESGSMRLSASRRIATGYDHLYDDSRRSQLQFRGDFRVSPSDDLSVQAGVATEAFGEGFAPVPCDNGNALCDENKQRTDRWRNGHVRIDWTRQIGEGSLIKGAAGIDHEVYVSSFLAEIFQRFPVVLTWRAPLDFGGRASRHNLEIQRSDIWSGSLRTVVGGEILREEVRAPFLFTTTGPVSANKLRLFGGIEWKPDPAWVVNTGAMWERHSLAGATFAPRLAVNHHLDPEHTLRVVTTQSFRMPSPYMLRGLGSIEVTVTPPLVPSIKRPYVAASGTIRPESVIANELGYLGDLRRLGLKVDLRAFSERINRRHLGDGKLDFVNYPGPDLHGFEYQLDWRPLAETRIVLAEAQMRSEPGRDGIVEHYEAPHRTGSLALYQKLPGGLDLTLIRHHATSFQWGTGQQLPGMRQLDLRLAWSFRHGATCGEVAWTVQALDGGHTEFERGQTFGRNAHLSLRLDF